MNIDEEIKEIVSQIRTLGQRIRWLRRNRARLEKVAKQGNLFGGRLDFDRLSHKEVIQTIKAIGGKWKKTPGHEPGKIDYTTEIEGVEVKCWAGEPPPSCRIIEVEELIPEVTIPAHTKKVRKMVCAPELPAQIAIARDAAKADAVSPVVQPLK